MREIARPQFIVLKGHVIKPTPGNELVVYEVPIPEPEDYRKKGRPWRNGQPT